MRSRDSTPNAPGRSRQGAPAGRPADRSECVFRPEHGLCSAGLVLDQAIDDLLYGARPLRRLVRSAIDDQLARQLLAARSPTATPSASTSTTPQQVAPEPSPSPAPDLRQRDMDACRCLEGTLDSDMDACRCRVLRAVRKA
ncbi:MAG: hypothetical protein ACRDOY_07500, partial [Nocardioidaceae bacterium]